MEIITSGTSSALICSTSHDHLEESQFSRHNVGGDSHCRWHVGLVSRVAFYAQYLLHGAHQDVARDSVRQPSASTADRVAADRQLASGYGCHLVKDESVKR